MEKDKNPWHIGQNVYTTRDGENWSFLYFVFNEAYSSLHFNFLDIAQIVQKKEVSKGEYEFYVHFKRSLV